MKDGKKTDLIIEELRKRAVKERTVDVEEEKVKIVVFTLRDGRYGFPGSDVKEILPGMDISPVPGAPDFIPGVINNRGNIESVINLNRFLGLPDSERTAATRIAIVAKAGVRSGVLMDSVVDVVDVPVSSLKPPLSTLDDVKRELVSGETMHGGLSVVMLDAGKVFGKLAPHGK